MANLNGDWFHSRSSSNLSELETVRLFVLRSHNIDYMGLHWSAGREQNQQLFDFASVANVRPSTMQTKIRSMIRYGFVKNGDTCPLIWTRMGSLWNDLYTIGNLSAAQQIYEITLLCSLAIYAFNNTNEQYSLNPNRGELPLRFLLNNLNINNAIPLTEFAQLIDGHKIGIARNKSYWKKDLLNSGLFIEENQSLVLTAKYSSFANEIKNFIPNELLDDNDWIQIRENPLIDMSPFKASISEIFEFLSNQPEEITEDPLTEPLIDVISEQEEYLLPEIDILTSNERLSTTSRRIRNATWRLRIKRKYSNCCVVPNCDVQGKIFVDSAHIKPDKIPDGQIPHRAHILNGLCLCKHCHIAFDHGLFSLTDDYRIITSSRFSDIVDQNLKTVILSSSNQIIKERVDHRKPLLEFVQYHREHLFK